MKNKEKYLEVISNIEYITSDLNISKTVFKDLFNLKEKIKKFKVLVPVVGGFSAGKTSLINSYFGTDFKTDILPETAIAAEIHYCKNEKIIAHSQNGEVCEYDISEINSIPIEKYTFLQVYLDNSKINELEDIVIVDMPGLDSKIEQHNKAIFNYINEGSYYILVSDIDYGIKESTLNFLNEINMYNIDFSVVLSKIDHKLTEDVESIFNNTKTNVNMFAGRNIFIGKTSTKINEIQDFHYILKNINVDLVVQNKFKNRIDSILDNIISELVILEKSSKIDTAEIEKKIPHIENGLKEIELKIREEDKRIEDKLQEEVKSNIIKDLRNELNNNIYTLTQAIKNGNDVFTQSVNEIIRPILTISTNENISFAFQESIENISKETGNIFKLSELITIEGDKIIDTFLKTVDILNNESFNKRYKYLGGILAITTDIVAPWMEIIILTLPEIIKIFGIRSEKREEEKIKIKLEQEIIPRIITMLKPHIEKHLEIIRSEFIDNLKSEMDENKNRLVELLQNTIKEKELKEVEFIEDNKKIKSSIEKIKLQKKEL